MNSLTNFFRCSNQFKHISEKLFKNVFKIDHYAYRSFNKNNIIDKYPHYRLEPELYKFDNNVTANWLSSNENNPSIFVSQYEHILKDHNIKKSNINLDKLHHYINSKDVPEYNFYKQVNNHNQYLAWTLLFREEINHVGFLVNDIEETLDTIKTDFPKYQINNLDKPIQISNDQNLLQFSIKSELIDYKFKDKVEEVPFTFIEFVERKNGRRGFETNNAQKIFESTK
jgi:hypothetical protein